MRINRKVTRRRIQIRVRGCISSLIGLSDEVNFG